MPEPIISYTPRPDATPQGELSTLVSVYRFVLDCQAMKKAFPDGRPNETERRSRETGATAITQRTA